MQTFQSVQEVYEAVGKVRDGLRLTGDEASAEELSTVLDGYNTTATEWLIELAEALKKTRSAWSTTLSLRRLGDHTIKEATRLMNLR